MQEKPYFCPNCRSNRTKFQVVSSYSRQFNKDAVTGEIKDLQEAVEVMEREPMITCLVCQFTGNEMRYIKQAEREPRIATATNPAYM